MTCPYHISLRSLIFISNRSTLTVPLIYSFLTLSFLVTYIANPNILISATFISSTCFFVTATVLSLFMIAGLTAVLYTVLYTFLFTLAGNLLSQIIPDAFLHLFHPASTLFFTSLSQLLFSCTIAPEYLIFFTLGTFMSFIFTISLSFPPFRHRYSVSNLFTFFPLLSYPYLQHSSLRSTSSLVSSQITISLANNIVHGGSLLTSFIGLSIITANRNGLNANLLCSPNLILKLSEVPTAHLAAVSLPHTYPVQVAHTFLPFLIFQYHRSSLGTLS